MNQRFKQLTTASIGATLLALAALAQARMRARRARPRP